MVLCKVLYSLQQWRIAVTIPPPYPIIFKKNFALRHRLHSKMLSELPTGINYSRGTSGLISSYRNANYLTVWQYLVKTNNQAGLRPTCTGCVYDVVRLQLRILFSKLQSSPIVGFIAWQCVATAVNVVRV